MKNFTIVGFLSLALFMSFLSCEDNSFETGGAEPFFKARFINQDSLTRLNSYINLINVHIRSINEELSSIEEREDNGDATDYTEVIDSLNSQKDSLDRKKVLFNGVIKDINSGKMQIDRLTAEGSMADITYSDSLNLYQIPLNSNNDTSRYFITIAGDTDTVTTTYSRATAVKERVVLINAYDFKISGHTFNDVTIIQSDSTNFSSNEATATFYF